jgi:hypothetical protein
MNPSSPFDIPPPAEALVTVTTPGDGGYGPPR